MARQEGLPSLYVFHGSSIAHSFKVLPECRIVDLRIRNCRIEECRIADSGIAEDNGVVSVGDSPRLLRAQ